MLEGELQGTETCASTGRRYSFAGHFLGQHLVVWRAVVVSQSREFCGQLSGELPVGSVTSDEMQVMIDALVRVAIRDGVGYRKL